MLSETEYAILTYLAQHGHTDRIELQNLFPPEHESDELIRNLIDFELVASELHAPKLMLTPRGLSELKRHQDSATFIEMQLHRDTLRYVITTFVAGAALVVALLSLIFKI